VFDHLWWWRPDTGETVPFLATRIEQPDQLHIVCTMGDAVFHDKPPVNGRAVKSSDVKASLETAARQVAMSNAPWWMTVFDHVETPDDRTATIVLKQPNAWSFTPTNGAGAGASSILPQELTSNIDFMDHDVIGSGQYQFVSQENGTNFKLERFPKWRIQGQPYLAGLQYKLIQEQAAADAAFAAQQIDVLAPNNKLERDQLLQKMGANNVTARTGLSNAIWWLEIQANGAFADPRSRQAISMALNRQEFIQLMYFGEAQISGPIPPTFKTYALPDDALRQTWAKEDVAEAKKLLSASGFDTSKQYTLKYYTPGDPQAKFAQIVQSQLAKNLGIQIQLVSQTLNTWLSQSLYAGDFDFISYPDIAYEDPASFIEVKYVKSIGGRPNYSHFFNDELDGLIQKQAAIFDTSQREAAVLDIQKRAWDLGAPFIPTIVPQVTTLVTAQHVATRAGGW
jgi:peptide/nickel transport system substrate-binding protein